MSPIGLVEEIPGLYGSLKVEEKIIQKIWHEQNFDSADLATECGAGLEISYSGIWNQTEEGPDFKNANILLNGRKINGDIEIHFQAHDWFNHGHHQDSNYEKVILHVTLFPLGSQKNQSKTKKGKVIPQLVLLPRLPHSLEELLEKQVIESLAGYDSILPLGFQSPVILNEMREKNHLLAQQRWKQKKKFARKRLSTVRDPKQALNECFLEVLGYKRNRPQMAKIAQLFPMNEWIRNRVEPKDAFDSIHDWKLRGLRPANHPYFRLEQYKELCQKNPQWCESLFGMKIHNSKNADCTDRKKLGLSKLNREWKENILAGVWRGTRVHTLWIDACLPLLAEIHQQDYFATWFHWYAGDFPRTLKVIAQEAKIAGHCSQIPYSNGSLQGILGYCIENRIFE